MVNPSSSKKENEPPWRQVRGEIPCGGSQTGEGSCGLVPPRPPVPGASEEERRTVDEQLRGGGVVVMVSPGWRGPELREAGCLSHTSSRSLRSPAYVGVSRAVTPLLPVSASCPPRGNTHCRRQEEDSVRIS